MSETHLNLAVRQTVVSGAVAGDVSVPGIRQGDALKSVINVTAEDDLTDEFEITEDGTINNEGGTSSDTGTLIVMWIAHDERGGHLDRT